MKTLLLLHIVSLSVLAFAAGRQDETWALKTTDKKASLYVNEVGTGEPVIMLHGGFGSDSTYMRDLSRGLESKYRFVYYDQRGSLRSPCNPDDVSFAKHVEDLETLRTELGIEKVTLVAHSAGTLLACAYLKAHPERVKRLVMCGFAQPKSRFSPSDFPPGTPPIDWKEYGKRISEFNDRPEIEREIKKNGLDKENLTSKQATDLWRIRYAGANCYNVDRWREMQGLSHFFNIPASKATKDLFDPGYDFLATLRENKAVRITVIEGTHDFCDFGGNMFKSLFANDKHVTVIVLQNAGHMMWIDDRKGFQKALDGALKR